MRILSFTLLAFLTLGFISADSPTIQDDNVEEINWMPLNEALELHKSNPKKLLINMVTDWCAACKQMGKTTYVQPNIVSYINEHFYAVRMDAQMKEPFTFLDQEFLYNDELLKGGVHDLAVHLTNGNLTFPTTVFLDEYLVNPQPVTGFQSADQLGCLMAFFGENNHYEAEWNVFKDFYSNKKND